LSPEASYALTPVPSPDFVGEGCLCRRRCCADRGRLKRLKLQTCVTRPDARRFDVDEVDTRDDLDEDPLGREAVPLPHDEPGCFRAPFSDATAAH